ncbi:MAG TPA: Stp1/IreP family PP2C-type Ser/Thr phosphatase [Nitrososphaeraceae archaeon]|nr:Stp1/IreP family PP2C-type Ser/Thr phosphatase [Nitrososphaeraceae archaeon]
MNSHSCHFEIGSKTDIGLVRKKNEDSLFVDEDLKLFVIADGMGGHSAGEIASKIAIDTISQYTVERLNNDDVQEKDLNKLLLESINLANSKILKESTDNPYLNGMGTTAVFAITSEQGNIHLVNLGDSRAYLIDNRVQNISKLTTDHTLVEDHFRRGLLSKEETIKHPMRHILTQSLGLNEEIVPFLTYLKFPVGNYLLLCSDGLNEMMTDKEILNVVTDPKIKICQEKCNKLVEISNEKGGVDNISIILVKNLGPDSTNTEIVV